MPQEIKFKNVVWHNVVNTACIHFIWYYSTILTFASFWFCLYCWMYVIEGKGSYIHIDMLVCCCVLFYVMDYPSFDISAYADCLKVIHLPNALHIFSCWTLSGWISGFTIFLYLVCLIGIVILPSCCFFNIFNRFYHWFMWPYCIKLLIFLHIV